MFSCTVQHLREPGKHLFCSLKIAHKCTVGKKPQVVITGLLAAVEGAVSLAKAKRAGWDSCPENAKDHFQNEVYQLFPLTAALFYCSRLFKLEVSKGCN